MLRASPALSFFAIAFAMGRIQSNIGLVTGINIGDTVDKLMSLASKPREVLATRTETLKKEQVAVTELSALLLTVRFATENLGKADLYRQRTVTSGNESVLAARVTGQPASGTYQFTPLRTAQYNQHLSSGLAADNVALGGGKVTFRFGAHVERALPLETLGGGQGFARGKIRITDRNGSTGEIDLSTAQTLADVVEALNGNTSINVAAEIVGDRIRLVDHTGQSKSRLIVQEVGGGSTAASLGLAGIDTADASADGSSLVQLSRNTELDWLNDGNGANFSTVLGDIQYELRDGTQGWIDLSPLPAGASKPKIETNLGQVIDAINAVAPTKLKAEIAADGKRLVLTDLTAGGGQFKLTAGSDSDAVKDLGLDGPAVDGVISGRRLMGGLKSVLLSSLNGGQGLGQLGELRLTDRAGGLTTVNLSTAETLDDVVGQVNATNSKVRARINAARNGIDLFDTSGGAGNLIVNDTDGSGTAAKLHVAVNAAKPSINSGDLGLQFVSHNTRLSSLNGGAGVAAGKIVVVDSAGRQGTLDLATAGVTTVGELLKAFNRLDVRIRAELNETGDGIRIRDTAGGTGKLQVLDQGSTAAADLHLLTPAVSKEINGTTTQVVDGSATYAITLSSTDTLANLRDKIDGLAAGVKAGIFFDGSSKPYRLSVSSERTGAAGQLVVDTSAINLPVSETVAARNALLAVGSPGSGALLASSASNTFKDVLAGVSLEIKQSSATPITISVTETDTNLVATVQTMVDNYNKFRTRLATLTKYDPQTNKGELLAGDSTALRLDTELSGFFSRRFLGLGSIQSMAEVGVGIKDDGTLTFDSARLKQKFSQDPQGVKRFLADENSGISKRFKQLAEELTGQDKSLMAHRFKSLDRKIKDNEDRIAWYDSRLERQRESLLMKFYRMELAIGKIQNNLNSLGAIQPISMPSGDSGN